jgi:D-sedoheptulose 7-phosphate isomerase
VGRFEKERKPLPAMILHGNSSSVTAIGNDYSYDQIFSRQIEAFAKKGDIVIALSTSGNSKML